MLHDPYAAVKFRAESTRRSSTAHSTEYPSVHTAGRCGQSCTGSLSKKSNRSHKVRCSLITPAVNKSTHRPAVKARTERSTDETTAPRYLRKAVLHYFTHLSTDRYDFVQFRAEPLYRAAFDLWIGVEMLGQKVKVTCQRRQE